VQGTGVQFAIGSSRLECGGCKPTTKSLSSEVGHTTLPTGSRYAWSVTSANEERVRIANLNARNAHGRSQNELGGGCWYRFLAM